MKFGKTALLILGAGIFIIAFATMYYLHSGQVKEQARLTDRLAAAQSLLPKLLAEKEDWQGRLTQMEKKVTDASLSVNMSAARFPISVESFDYDAALFKTADDCGLQVLEITVPEPGEEEIKDSNITYSTTIFKVVVQSKKSPPDTADSFENYVDETVANILKFIDAIATGEKFNVSSIEQVDMKNLKLLDAEELETIAEDRQSWPQATIQLVIYGFPR
jgi:hypothetical protein